MAESPLETLLVVQEHDTAADRLRHRRDDARRAGRAAGRGGARWPRSTPSRATLATRRAEIDANERRLGDEVASIAGKATAVEKSMYSGEISSPRELQAMQADVEQLRKQQALLEDRELELMETREQLDAEMGELDATRTAGAGRDRPAPAGHRRARGRDRRGARDRARSPDHRRRDAARPTWSRPTRRSATANGVGAARLVGMSCQACHLTIPSTEVDRMRRAATPATDRRHELLRQLRRDPRPDLRRSRRDACDVRSSSPATAARAGNPGPAAIGAVIYDATTEPPTLLQSISERIGVATNNVAEYQALVRALEAAAESRCPRACTSGPTRSC